MVIRAGHALFTHVSASHRVLMVLHGPTGMSLKWRKYRRGWPLSTIRMRAGETDPARLYPPPELGLRMGEGGDQNTTWWHIKMTRAQLCVNVFSSLCKKQCIKYACLTEIQTIGPTSLFTWSDSFAKWHYIVFLSLLLWLKIEIIVQDLSKQTYLTRYITFNNNKLYSSLMRYHLIISILTILII